MLDRFPTEPRSGVSENDLRIMSAALIVANEPPGKPCIDKHSPHRGRISVVSESTAFIPAR
jgi:hypothetical protein